MSVRFEIAECDHSCRECLEGGACEWSETTSLDITFDGRTTCMLAGHVNDRVLIQETVDFLNSAIEHALRGAP